jgi:hypothetical protein
MLNTDTRTVFAFLVLKNLCSGSGVLVGVSNDYVVMPSDTSMKMQIFIKKSAKKSEFLKTQ